MRLHTLKTRRTSFMFGVHGVLCVSWPSLVQVCVYISLVGSVRTRMFVFCVFPPPMFVLPCLGEPVLGCRLFLHFFVFKTAFALRLSARRRSNHSHGQSTAESGSARLFRCAVACTCPVELPRSCLGTADVTEQHTVPHLRTRMWMHATKRIKRQDGRALVRKVKSQSID